jgi:hypothetical protein
VDGSSLPDIRAVSEISLAALQSRFASRHPLQADHIERLADRVSLLRLRYNEQLQRAKIQFVDPRLKLSSCRALLVMARAVVSVSQLVYEAVRSLDAARLDPARPAVSPDVVETGLAWNDLLLARIAGHLHGLDTADAHSAWLKILLTQLEKYPRISSSDWTRLAQQVLAAGADRLDAELGLPLPSVALKSYFEEIGQARYADVMGRGIEAAQIVARTVLRRSAIGFDPELLTVAALCQDCGLLLGSSRSASKAQMRALHASIGAGLAASLVELATELPVLVAEHHRRLNEPLVAPNVLPRNRNCGSRILGVIVRWLELIDDMGPRAAEHMPLTGTVAFSEPARRLVRETLRGDWDRSIAGDLMDTLGFRSESQALREADRIARFGIREDVRRRVDSADERWPQPNLELPNLELEPRNRESHHVRAAR